MLLKLWLLIVPNVHQARGYGKVQNISLEKQTINFGMPIFSYIWFVEGNSQAEKIQ